MGRPARARGERGAGDPARVTDPPETPAEVQLAVDAGFCTWGEITAALTSLGLAEAAIAEWKAGNRTVDQVVVDRVRRGLD